jgi:hypothetical protein
MAKPPSQTLLETAKEQLDDYNDLMASAYALVCVAESQDKIAEILVSIDLKLERLVQYAGLRNS